MRHLPAGLLLSVSVVLFPVALARAQAPPAPPSPLAEKANQEFMAGNWEAARAAYAQLADATPDSALYRFRLAGALVNLGRPAEALPLIDKAEALGWAKPQVAFRRATAHARLGDKDAAFRAIEAAARAGFVQIPLLQSDPSLASLREDARWKGALEAVDRIARPCLYDAKYREFDFWLGTWDVRPNGAPVSQPPATNVITKEHDGCVIHESWTAPGSNGQSFNIYDSSRGRWYQTWVDNSGGLHEYSGNVEDGTMVYTAELAATPPQTGRVHTRLRFFNQGPDTVRQFSEATTDGGKTWTVNYDLIYTRRAGTSK